MPISLEWPAWCKEGERKKKKGKKKRLDTVILQAGGYKKICIIKQSRLLIGEFICSGTRQGQHIWI